MLEWTKETLFGDKLGHYKTLAFAPFLFKILKEKKIILNRFLVAKFSSVKNVYIRKIKSL